MPFIACLTNTQQRQQLQRPSVSRSIERHLKSRGYCLAKMLASTIQLGRSVATSPGDAGDAGALSRGAESQPVLSAAERRGLIPQGPTVCQDQARGARAPGSTSAELTVLRRPIHGRGLSSTIPLVNTTSATQTFAGRAGCVLLRKEVIQPHLPVRLPCYDFVPIASPTFDRSPQQAGWATGFGCCRLS